ncbi:MAG TPA: asparagine synthase-related protein [Vicinamibacterales bacterium]|nr:asparagine synthase-related protein [Vicinamibacterales bacterium]
MLDGVERLVDLTGAAVTRDPQVVEALASGDGGRVAAIRGHFAAVARRGRTVILARTIGVPLRYFVAKMYHGPFLVVAERVDRIFDWCCEQRIAWQFDPAYTRMVPAHYLVELDQVGCPDPAPRYERFFRPAIGHGTSDLQEAGAGYIAAAADAVREWIEQVPQGQPVVVAFSGGVDSTAILLLARKAMTDLGRSPDDVRAVTLDLGDGSDAQQAELTVRALGIEQSWERIQVPADRYDLEDAIRVIEDYHPLDVECAAAGLCLLRAVRQRYPEATYLLDGDGGDENLKSYPLDDSDLTISSVLSNPLLYHEGWGIDAIKHSLAYSGGLSRGYVRSYAPAAAWGFRAFSPYTVRPVIARALEIPFGEVVDGSPERLAALKQDVVVRGVKAVAGIEMPAHPKRRFQDGAMGTPRTRVSKAWCRRTFDRLWSRRLRAAEQVEWRSGNEVSV